MDLRCHSDFNTKRKGALKITMGTRLVFCVRLALATIACLLFCVDCHILTVTPLPGVDSYYYLVQERHLALSGTLYYPCFTPLVFVLPAILIFFRVSPEGAWQIGTISALLLLCSGLYACSWRISRSRVRALLALVLLLASPSVDFLIVEFGKECLALACLLWAVYFYYEASAAGWTSRPLALFVLICCAGLMSHSLFGLLGVFLLGTELATRILERQFWLGATTVVGFLISAIYIDIAIMRYLAPTAGSWRVFALHNPVWGVYSRELIVLETVLPVLILAATVCPKLVHGRIVLITLLISLVTVLSPVFAPSDPGSFASRLKGITFLYIAFILPNVTKGQILSIQGFIVAGVVCLTLWTQHRIPIVPGETQSFLLDRKALYNALRGRKLDLPPESIIIADHGTEFLVTYLTDKRSAHSVPRNQDRVWLVRYIPVTHSSNPALLMMNEGTAYAAVLTDAQLETLLKSCTEFERWTLIHRNSAALQAEY